MAIVRQMQLFGWEEVEELGDLERVRLVLSYLPDESLMLLLEKERGRGRNDYPVRAIWNSVIAGVILQHPSIEALRRELSRNETLLRLCGFDLMKGERAVPPSWAYTRFLRNLMKHLDEIEAMFDRLVDSLCEVLPGFGSRLAVDSKAVRSAARRPKKGKKAEKRDGRRDIDAKIGVKKYWGLREDGTLWQKVKTWFGYKLHLLVDSDYELPVAFEVTVASEADIKGGRKLIEKTAERHPAVLETCNALAGDKGFDDAKFIAWVWTDLGIKAVIDIRNLWKDGEKTHLVSGQSNVVYDYQGNVFCYCPKTGEVRQMPYGGFEKDRETLKFRCPAKHYEIHCEGADICPVRGAIRIKLKEDQRVFTPLARCSYAWDREYDKRTAVERVNSRLAGPFNLDKHFIRGLKKMKLKCSLALIVMLAMALGRVKQNQKEKMRSLVQAA